MMVIGTTRFQSQTPSHAVCSVAKRPSPLTRSYSPQTRVPPPFDGSSAVVIGVLCYAPDEETFTAKAGRHLKCLQLHDIT